MAAKWSRTTAERGNGRFGRPSAIAILAGVIVATPAIALAQPYGGAGGWSGYDRKGTFARSWQGDWPRDFKRRDFDRRFESSTSANWFQRPYPYHLDYYRMRYGGSYAPYFGNLYGPPQVYAPWYGNVGPYSGPNEYGYGYAAPYGNGYPPPNGYGYGPPNGFAGEYGCPGPYCNQPGGYPNGAWVGPPVEQPEPPVDAEATQPTIP